MIDPFDNGSSWEQRYIPDHNDLRQRIDGMRQGLPGIVVVLVMGAYDLKHVGHDRYLELAAKAGADLAKERLLPNNYIVVVGVDSDEKIRANKGKNRPVVPLEERLEQLCHLRHVTFVTRKDLTDPRWNLIVLAQPDILIATQETYSEPELEELKQYCQEVRVFERQAETSSTGRIRQLLLDYSSHIEQGAKAFKGSFNKSFKRFSDHVQGFWEKPS